MATVTPSDRAVDPAADIEKSGTAEALNAIQDDEKYETDESSMRKQDGVKRVEAVTTAWTTKTLWLMFVLLYLVSFVDGVLNSVQYSLNPYITSSFQQHALLSTIGIVSSTIGGTFNFLLAKIVDVWGRVEGFLFMLCIIVVGLIMKCFAQNVQTYAAAHTLFWVGHLGLLYVINIIVADMTTLKNRMLMFTINGTPTIASTFAGPAIAQLFYEESNFRWAFGAFCIILVGVSVPVVALMLFYQKRADKLGLTPEKTHNRTLPQNFKHYFVEFDIIGILLISAGWVLLLLPFSLANSYTDGWKNTGIICMIVFGVVTLALFVIWERSFAPKQFFPFKFLKDRTIIGACLLYGVMFISIFSWNGYYGSYLQVVHNQSIRDANYILNAFSLSSSFISPFIGFLISRTGDFKYTGYAGVPFVVLGTALLIPFRTPTTHIGLLVMCELFMGIGTGIFATCAQLAVMAAVSHQEIAVVIALWGMFGSIGAAIGFAISGGIWTQTLPQRIFAHLPEESKNLTMTIYSSFTIPQEYPMGDPIRIATNTAYAEVQRLMIIAGACFIPLLLIFVAMWRSINVKKLERENGTQAKGTIF